MSDVIIKPVTVKIIRETLDKIELLNKGKYQTKKEMLLNFSEENFSILSDRNTG
jgi:hypothetical protein